MVAMPGEVAVGRCLRPRESGEFTLKEKRSEFVAMLFRVDDADEARAALDGIRRQHRGAAHHCPAWRIGFPQTQEFCSDDGEPAGTAGRPILGELRKAQLCCAEVVVTRYFGGVKLGVRGLIDAYGAAAAAVIEKTSTELCAPLRPLTLQFHYGHLNAFLRLIRCAQIAEEHIKTLFGVNATLQVFAAPSAERFLRGKLDEYETRRLLLEEPLWGEPRLLPLKGRE